MEYRELKPGDLAREVRRIMRDNRDQIVLQGFTFEDVLLNLMRTYVGRKFYTRDVQAGVDEKSDYYRYYGFSGEIYTAYSFDERLYFRCESAGYVEHFCMFPDESHLFTFFVEDDEDEE